MIIRSLALSLAALPFLLSAAEPITRIACGSCYKPKSDKGIFKSIAKEKPNIFLFMGDNIYGDTSDMQVLKEKYRQLTSQPDFQAFAKEVPILATWDDHDYGLNDAGREYSKRRESQQIFQDVFGFPADHPARKTEGIYHSKILGPSGKRVQFIMLDTRYFRSPLEQMKINGRKDYLKATGPGATMLGTAQWAWLAQELTKPAELRIIVSSIQVLTTSHRFEKWGNMPDERARFLDLLKSTNSGPTILLSGDRHLAEIFKMPASESGRPDNLFEMTTSGLTHAGASDDPSPYRIEGTYFNDLNYGVIDLDWSGKKPAVTLHVKGFDGKAASSTKISF
ncbi:alkaline phosphatase D family protein [Verrucomicrobiaceae bacterium 227]